MKTATETAATDTATTRRTTNPGQERGRGVAQPNWSWRALLVASGVTGLLGGSMHPSSDTSKDPIRREFATMMNDDAWIPGHALMALSALLLALAVYQIHRRGLWASARKPLTVGLVVFPLYVVEALFHLFSYIDADRLEAGDFPPIAWTHVGLAAVLYPATGALVVWLAWTLARQWEIWQRVFAFGAIVGGIAFALALPLTLAFPDMETSPFFALGGILPALWSIAAGLIGIRTPANSA